MPDGYYRHPSSDEERDALIESHVVESQNPESSRTYFTLDRYDDPETAKKELALSHAPTHRIGPLRSPDMPEFVVGPRRVQPMNGEPGGGREVAVEDPVFLFGLMNMVDGEWSPDV